MRPKVIIGLQEWNLGGPCIFAERLIRGLSAIGWDASALITESDSVLLSEKLTPRAIPDDIVVECLPAGYHDTWGMRWEALIRYIEERAPCFYIMVSDWRNNVVASRLSDRVFLIGLVQADYELEYNQALRLGHYWNAVVAVSDILQYTLANRAPWLAPRLVTIRNAVPALEQIPQKAQEGPLQIAYSGELRHGQKRLGDLIKIAYGLDAKKIPFEMTLIGDGPFRAGLEELAHPLIESGKVKFAGRFANAELLDALTKFDVFVLTSEFEGLSISLLEAMSRGCVPVVSNLATQSLVIRDGINAYGAPIGDIDTFVDRLAKLANSPEQRQKMAQAAFQTIIDGGYRVEDMLSSYITLFDKIEEMSRLRRFIRHRGWMPAPPQYIGNLGILPSETKCRYDLQYVNEQPLWPNPAPPTPVQTSAKQAKEKNSSARATTRLEDYRVVVAIPAGQISGVDVFATHMVRHLRHQGIEAKIIGGRQGERATALPLAEDLPIDTLPIRENTVWLRRWDAMIAYLESQAPCIYIPNYDYEYSGICPQLSNDIKIVSIAHSDDPMHYEHVLRLGQASNAIVGVSHAIVQHLSGLDSSLIPRMHTIPYGIELPLSRSVRVSIPQAPLRIVYAGRLVNYQKRVNDLIEIAKLLDERHIPFELTIIGDGVERENLHNSGRKLILKRKLRLIGKLTNEEVMEVFRESDVFLLPSSFEGLAVSLLEAMSCGLIPVVSNMRSGVPDLIRDGENGFVVTVGDIQGFTDKLVYLYAHFKVRQCMADAAYNTICMGNYSVEDMVERYCALFSSVIVQPFVRQRGPILPPDDLKSALTWKSRTKYYLQKQFQTKR